MNPVGLTLFTCDTSKIPIFHYFVYKSMGSSSAGSPVDSSHILSHIFHNIYLINLAVFVFEREQNYLQDDIKLLQWVINF